MKRVVKLCKTSVYGYCVHDTSTACLCMWTHRVLCPGVSCKMHHREAACSWLFKQRWLDRCESHVRIMFWLWLILNSSLSLWGLTICPWRKGSILWAMCHTDFQVDLRTALLARPSSPLPSLWIWVSLMVQRSQPSVFHDKHQGGIAIPLSLTWKLRWKAKNELLWGQVWLK